LKKINNQNEENSRIGTLSERNKIILNGVYFVIAGTILFLMTVIGFMFFIVSIIWAIFIIYKRIFGGIALEGWTTLMAFNNSNNPFLNNKTFKNQGDSNEVHEATIIDFASEMTLSGTINKSMVLFLLLTAAAFITWWMAFNGMNPILQQ
jgi:hypothetical protein